MCCLENAAPSVLLLLWTVCTSNDPTDTLSVSTTQLTAVDHAPAPMGLFTVSASPAHSLHALTPSHSSAAGPVKAAYMRAKSDLMGRRGMMHQTHVHSVFAVRALSSVRGSAVHWPTVTTQSGDSAACPVIAACFMVKNILMALSLLMTKTPVACVTVTVGRSSAPRYCAMENAATLTNHLGNAVENVNAASITTQSSQTDSRSLTQETSVLNAPVRVVQCDV